MSILVHSGKCKSINLSLTCLFDGKITIQFIFKLPLLFLISRFHFNFDTDMLPQAETKLNSKAKIKDKYNAGYSPVVLEAAVDDGAIAGWQLD